MNRNLTNFIRYFFDELLPPILRDNKYFMYPFFWVWYKGKQVSERMEFKSKIHELTEDNYAEFYKITDSRSHDRPTDLNKESIQKILSELKDFKDKKIIDVGCGRGFFLNLLRSNGFSNLHGLDLFEDLDLENIQYHHGNIEKLPFIDKEFDVVIASHTIEHVLNLDIAINELKRITKSKLIITVPKQRYYHYTFDLHIHFFTEKSYLINAIKMQNFECSNQGGDWVYVGKNH